MCSVRRALATRWVGWSLRSDGRDGDTPAAFCEPTQFEFSNAAMLQRVCCIRRMDPAVGYTRYNYSVIDPYVSVRAPPVARRSAPRDVPRPELCGCYRTRAGIHGLRRSHGSPLRRTADGGLPVSAFITTTALTVLLGVSFVGLAIGGSAVPAARPRAMTLAITGYLGLTLLWGSAPTAVYSLITSEMPGGVVPAWFLPSQGLSRRGRTMRSSSGCCSAAELPWKRELVAQRPATSIQQRS